MLVAWFGCGLNVRCPLSNENTLLVGRSLIKNYCASFTLFQRPGWPLPYSGCDGFG